jgi:tetratricopeptide (TPR) repeat protein
LKSGNHSEAIKYFQKALEINPDDTQALNNLGLTFTQLGKLDEAMSYFNDSLKKNPNNLSALSNIATSYIALGKIKEGINYYDKILSIYPNDVFSLHGKASALYRLGKHDESLEPCNKALKLNPKFPNVWYLKGLILGKTEKKEKGFFGKFRINESEKCLKKALELGYEKTDSGIYCD